MDEEFTPRIISTLEHGGRNLFNITSLLKSFTSINRLKPAHFKPKYAGYTEKSLMVNGDKFVDAEWLFQFLSSSKFSLKKQFIEWVCQLFTVEVNSTSASITTANNTTINEIISSSFINIKTGMYMCCANCKHEVICPIPGKRAKKPIQDMSSKRSKTKLTNRIISTIKALLKNNGQNFEDLLAYHFKKDQNCFYNIFKMFLCDNEGNIQKKAQRYLNIKAIMKEKSKYFRTDKYSLLYLKDHLMISDDLLESIRKYINVDILPSETTIKRTRAEIDEEIRKKYEISDLVDGGLQIQVHKALSDMYKLHNKMKALHEEFIENSQSIRQVYCESKLSFDGGANAYTTMTLTPLNWSTFATQSRDSCLYCASYEGNENRSMIHSKFKDIFNQIQKWIKDGFTVDNISYKLKVFLVNDLKALSLITDLFKDGLFCPYYKCLKDNRGLFTQNFHARELRFDFRLDVDVIICTLHMKMRTVSNLLKQILLRINDQDDVNEIRTRIRSLAGCSRFDFRKEKNQDEDEDDLDQLSIEIPYLNGTQINSILANFEMILNGIADPIELMIWSLHRWIIFKYVDCTSDDLQGLDLDELRNCLSSLGILLSFRYPASKFAYYFHIMIKHLPDLIEKYGSLSRFANEGTENVHSLHMKAKTRSTSSGGRKSKSGKRRKNAFEQTFYQCLRRIFIPANYEQVIWIGKASEYGNQDDKSQSNLEENLQGTSAKCRTGNLSKWKPGIDEINNNISSPDFKDYLETLVTKMPRTAESTSFRLSRQNLTEQQRSQDNTQGGNTADATTRKRKRTEEEITSNINIDSRLEPSFYSSLNANLRKKSN
jgi:hypothetical protein